MLSREEPEVGRELRVAIVSKSDASGGGASRVAASLAGLLLKRGHHVEHHVAYCSEQKTYMYLLHRARGLSRLDALCLSLSRKSWACPI